MALKSLSPLKCIFPVILVMILCFGLISWLMLLQVLMHWQSLPPMGVRQLLLARRLPLMALFIIRFSFLMAVPSLPDLTR